MSVCLGQSVFVRLYLSVSLCQSVFVSPSLSVRLCQSIFVSPFLSVCLCQAVFVSLSLVFCPCLSVSGRPKLPITSWTTITSGYHDAMKIPTWLQRISVITDINVQPLDFR